MEETDTDTSNNHHREKAYLLEVPEVVLYDYLFPYLSFNDLLRLRLVCKPTKEFSDVFIRNNFSFQEREINEADITFSEFLRRNLPTKSVFINNTGPRVFEDPNVPEFLMLYADQITHLRVHHFSACVSDAEFQFFSALSKLEHLEVEFTNATNCLHVNISTTDNDRMPFPSNFKNLKTLKLNSIQRSELSDHRYAWDFIEFCTKSAYLKHPSFDHIIIDGKSVYPYDKTPFAAVNKLIKQRHVEFPDEPNLKFYDLEHHEPKDYHRFNYVELVLLCHEHGVKLLNVPAELYSVMWSSNIATDQGLFLNNPFSYTFLTPLVSVINVHGFMCLAELPNLEKLVIKSTGESSFTVAGIDNDNEGGDWPMWPKLKIIDLTLDSEVMCGDPKVPTEPTDVLINILFSTYLRSEMNELTIRFPELPGLHHFPLPRVQNITNSCPNITKLTLIDWLGTNKSLCKFWEGLHLLEEVTLEKSQRLGDVAFVGKRKEEPIFLNLKNLKKLTLKRLEISPKLTDLVFELVFRHLKIKGFYLQSERPLKLITVAGIESLLTGDFSNCVEKFPFDGWSLDGVSDEAFGQLKSRFRASHMS